MTTCSSCNAEIAWAVTTSGARMPMDVDPHPEGGFLLEKGDDGEMHAIYAPERTGPRYRSHFATCPFAHQHRKKKP